MPNVYDSNYDAFSKALAKSDFRGAKITAIASCDASVIGQMGLVAMEIKNTFKIVGRLPRFWVQQLGILTKQSSAQAKCPIKKLQ